MQLKKMPRRKRLSAGRAPLILFLCQMISALDVPLDPKLLEDLVQPPTITQQSPKDYIIDPRENIVIQCEAKGKPPPRWVCFLLCYRTEHKHWYYGDRSCLLSF